MPTDCISYQDSGYFTPIINDYLNQKPALERFYGRYPTLENFEGQIAEKHANYNAVNRQILVDSLQRQYRSFQISEATKANISALSNHNTFTITTGHQLNLFTGPLYFLYKIISAINLSAQLKSRYPESDFVPVYWMATEDHDFDEINYFNFNGKKFRWNRESSGPVGRLNTAGLDEVFEVFSKELGIGKNAGQLRDLFQKAYLEHHNLTDATRFLANELFGQHGLVILDGDDRELKKLFTPHLKRELFGQVSFNHVSQTVQQLDRYDIQVNPREINLFYTGDRLRERIIREDENFRVNNTQIRFTAQEMLTELGQNPQNFSPNVIMRPLYQEVILPNLCYIGGGGELAYWFELKSFFDAVEVTFPMLLLRNSVLITTKKQADKADRLELSWRDLFKNPTDLANEKIRKLSEFPIDLSAQKAALQKQFKDLLELADHTDKSFSGAVKAQQAKQTKGLENLEKRLLKAQKRKHADQLTRIADLQESLFPAGSLQERNVNFAEFYLNAGPDLIEKLMQTLRPLDTRFEIVTL